MKVRRRPRPDLGLGERLDPVIFRRRVRDVGMTPGATAFSFGECPRCKSMASALLSDICEVFAIDCQSCGLPGSTSIITIWNVQSKLQAGNHPSDIDEALVVAIRGGVEVTIWQGDVKMAHYSPVQDDYVDAIFFYNGYCHTVGY